MWRWSKIDGFLQFLPKIFNALFWFWYSMIGWRISEPNAKTEWRNIGWLGYYEQLKSVIEVDPVYGTKQKPSLFFNFQEGDFNDFFIQSSRPRPRFSNQGQWVQGTLFIPLYTCVFLQLGYCKKQILASRWRNYKNDNQNEVIS